MEIGVIERFLFPLAVGLVLFVLNMIKSAIDEWRKDMKENTKAIVALSTNLENLSKLTEKIPKIEQDLNALHAKVRGNRGQ